MESKGKGAWLPNYDNLPYRGYCCSECNNKIALNVKLSDLKCNMDINRIKNPTTNDYERIHKRYEPAYDKILNKLNEEER